MSEEDERYVLATGSEGAHRLGIVNRVHGPDTEAFLRRAGLKKGMRVADVGCGIGKVSCWMAKEMGANVLGVDVSAEQIRMAEALAMLEFPIKTVLDNPELTIGIFTPDASPEFRQASAYDTGLERGVFDLVFSRFLLMHLQRPAEAIAEMRALLKPGGILAIEDGDFASPFCEPPSAAYARCMELYRQIGAQHGEDFNIGRKLYRLAREAGFREAQVALAQPVFTRGEAKRLPEWTLAEAAPALIAAGLSTEDEINTLTASLIALAEDESVLFGMARMTQVWARKT